MIIDANKISDISKNHPDVMSDLMSLEMSIISATNNHFHKPGYNPDITEIKNNKIYLDDDNLFKPLDTIEIVGSKYSDGFYYVQRSSRNTVEVDGLLYDGEGGCAYLIDYPREFESHALEILKYKQSAEENRGIKSKSISRVSVSYRDTSESRDTYNGVPAYLYDFIAPYRKMSWS